MKYRKKPIVIEASQWFKNGDHPEDNCKTLDTGTGPFQSEGNIVRYYRTPECDGQNTCKVCDVKMHNHGWIDTLEGGHIVCPSDWIIKGIQNEFYPCKPDIFEATYDKVDTNEFDPDYGDDPEVLRGALKDSIEAGVGLMEELKELRVYKVAVLKRAKELSESQVGLVLHTNRTVFIQRLASDTFPEGE